jgi:hypothetical protein
MKSISAIAISEGWEAGRVTASGIWMGIFLILLGATSLIEVVNKIVPENVVSGLQIGVGIRLASKGVNMITKLGWIDTYDCILTGIICAVLSLFFLRELPRTTISDTTTRSMELMNEVCQTTEVIDDGCPYDHEDDNDDDSLQPSTHDAVVESSFINSVSNFQNSSSTCKQHKHPVGLYLFLIGLLFASITLSTTKNENEEYDLPLRFFGAPVIVWSVGAVTRDDWKYGLLDGALPQLPLSTLNSVISVCALAQSLYPEKRKRDSSSRSKDLVISRKEVALSIGIMNLLFCPLGSMPNCHGAGGLAGQHLLGARHGSSMVFLGFAKMIIAVFFGASALTVFDAFPDAVLGVMLSIAGQELATTGFTLLVGPLGGEASQVNCSIHELDGNNQKSKKLRQDVVIALITATVIISTGQTHVGALSGLIAHVFYGEGIHDLRRQLLRLTRKDTRNYNQIGCQAVIQNDDHPGYSCANIPKVTLEDYTTDQSSSRESQCNLVL